MLKIMSSCSCKRKVMRRVWVKVPQDCYVSRYSFFLLDNLNIRKPFRHNISF